MRARLARRLAAALLLAAAALAPRAAAHTPHDIIEAWAMSPAFPADHTLFVSLPRFNLLLRSTDAGETWTSCVKGLQTAYVTDLAISPEFAQDHTIWCAEVAGLFVSRDAGEHWENVAVPDGLRDITCIALSPFFAADKTLALGTRRNGLGISTDGGRTFEHITFADAPDGAGPVSSLAICGPDAAQTGVDLLLAGTGLLRVAVAQPGTRQTPHLLVRQFESEAKYPVGPLKDLTQLAPDGDTRYVASRRLGVLSAATGGVGWSEGRKESGTVVLNGVPLVIGQDSLPTGANVLHLSVAHEADGTTVLFASTADDGVQIKRGDGPWHASLAGFREPTHQTKEHWIGTMVSPGWATDHTVYACCFEGLYVSTDGGEHWRWLNTLHPQLVRNVALSPRFADDGALWLSTYGVGLQHSEDRGKTFTQVDTESWEFPDGIAVSRDWRPAGADAPATGALLIGTPNNMLLSRDGGATVASCLPHTKGFPRVLAFAPDWAASGIAFALLSADAGPKSNRFVRTADHGATWTDTNIRTAYDLACAPDWDTSGRCWAACPDGVFRSDDRGVTFAKVDTLTAAGLNSVAVAPGLPAEGGVVGPPCLAVASTGHGISLSRDAGATWSAPGNPPARTSFVRLSPDFARDGLVFAGTHTDGLWFSHDGGAHWARGEGGPRMTLCLEISPTFARDHTLVVGSYEQPWITSDSGATWRAIELPIPAGYVPAASREGDVDAALPPAPHKSGG